MTISDLFDLWVLKAQVGAIVISVLLVLVACIAVPMSWHAKREEERRWRALARGEEVEP